MSLAVINSIPLSSIFVPTCLENVINKKIAKVVLNCIEKLLDWICSWIYCPYISLYSKKVERIHTFSDGKTPLIDSTKQGTANVTQIEGRDYLTIQNEKVLFLPTPEIPIVFSKALQTDFVRVSDDPDGREGWYEITEQPLPRNPNETPMENKWSVNTNEKYRFPSINENFLIVEQPD